MIGLVVKWGHLGGTLRLFFRHKKDVLLRSNNTQFHSFKIFYRRWADIHYLNCDLIVLKERATRKWLGRFNSGSPCDMEVPGRTVMLLDAVLSASCNATSVMLVEHTPEVVAQELSHDCWLRFCILFPETGHDDNSLKQHLNVVRNPLQFTVRLRTTINWCSSYFEITEVYSDNSLTNHI